MRFNLNNLILKINLNCLLSFVNITICTTNKKFSHCIIIYFIENYFVSRYFLQFSFKSAKLLSDSLILSVCLKTICGLLWFNCVVMFVTYFVIKYLRHTWIYIFIIIYVLICNITYWLQLLAITCGYMYLSVVILINHLILFNTCMSLK
jgi:hypothetical protein